jgi:LacI family transcriptional regulator
MGGGGELSANMERYQGYCDGLSACGLPFDPALVVEGAGSVATGAECAHALLRRRQHRPTAIFASNDAMAAGALRAAHELGLSVPERLSVAGFEDDPIAAQVWPRLTTIRQPIQAMAEQAARLLMRQLRGLPRGRAQLKLVATEPVTTGSAVASALVIRQSTGRAPGRS